MVPNTLIKNMCLIKLAKKFLKMLIKDIIAVSLHMDKQAQANHIQ
jgi:hypothetical protein